MKLIVYPKRLIKDVPIADERTALALATADAIGSFVRITGDFNSLAAFRAALLQIRASGAEFADFNPAFSFGLIVAACYSTGKTAIKSARTEDLRLVDALKRVGANVRADGDTIFVFGTGKLDGGSTDAENDPQLTAYLAVAATVAETATEIENASGEFVSVFFAAGGKGEIYED